MFVKRDTALGMKKERDSFCPALVFSSLDARVACTSARTLSRKPSIALKCRDKRLDADFTWEQFAKDCVLNEYALVVGPEAILNRDVNPEAEGNSKKLLFDLWSLPKGRKNPTVPSISICNAKQ